VCLCGGGQDGDSACGHHRHPCLVLCVLRKFFYHRLYAVTSLIFGVLEGSGTTAPTCVLLLQYPPAFGLESKDFANTLISLVAAIRPYDNRGCSLHSLWLYTKCKSTSALPYNRSDEGETSVRCLISVTGPRKRRHYFTQEIRIPDGAAWAARGSTDESY
jgi:hypothetical protein